jgi:hypothetical protein
MFDISFNKNFSLLITFIYKLIQNFHVFISIYFIYSPLFLYSFSVNYFKLLLSYYIYHIGNYYSYKDIIMKRMLFGKD